MILFLARSAPASDFWDSIMHDGSLYARADLLILDLDAANNRTTVINENTTATLLTVGSTNPNFEALPRLTLGRSLDCCSAIEATYFWRKDWDASATVLGNNNLSLPGPLALATLDFFNADRMTTLSASELRNLELNYIRDTGYGFDWLAGFRYIEFNEIYNINSMDLGSGTSDYNIMSDNDMFGAQIGVRAQRCITDCVTLNAIGKAGVYGTTMNQRTFVGDFDNTAILRNSRTEGGQFSFTGEVALEATWQVTDCLSVVAGYNLLWLENVARAADQLDFTDNATSGTDLRENGNALFHGTNVGIVRRR